MSAAPSAPIWPRKGSDARSPTAPSTPSLAQRRRDSSCSAVVLGTALRIEGPGGTACIVSCLFPPGGQGQSLGARAFVDDSDSTWAWALERAAYERSEEHTSELQSRRDLVCRLLLEK